jgi:CBS domain-containing protein/ribosomal protein S27AE
LTKIKDVMSTNVPKVNYSSTVLEAGKIMNAKNSTGAVVAQGERVVGMITERVLLRRFLPYNKRPDEVKVSEVMAPLLKIRPDASTNEAAKKMIENGLTRLGVFAHDKFLGWVTLTDLARGSAKKNFIDSLLRHHEPEVKEVLCPSCRFGVLKKIVNRQGVVLRWECSKCHYTE